MRFGVETNFYEAVVADIGGIISGIGSAVGGAMSAGAAEHAADVQSAAANRAMDMQLQQYQQTQNNLTPYRAMGEGAVNKLQNIFGLESSAQQNGYYPGVTGAPGASGASAGGATPAPAAGWSVQPFGGVQGDGSYEHIITDPNGTQYYVAYNKDGSLNSAYDAGGNQITGLALATLTNAIPTAGSAGGSAGSSGGTGGGSPFSQTLGTGTPNMGVLQSYGISGLTYNPADYGLGNGVFQPTEAQLESMPGYQFTLDQGLKSAQNGYAARGLGSSGAAMKGAAQYATGLADQTLNTEANIFNNNVARTQGIFQNNLSNVLNPLMQFATGGQNAAISQGQIGANGINSAANSLIGGANASAAGSVGAANAIGSGINNGINNYMQYNMLQKLMDNANGGNVYEDTSSGFA